MTERKPTNTYGWNVPEADIVRAHGWGPGTRLIGDEGYGPTIIRITAVGEQNILAIAEGDRNWEFTWTLKHRDWKEVTT